MFAVAACPRKRVRLVRTAGKELPSGRPRTPAYPFFRDAMLDALREVSNAWSVELMRAWTAALGEVTKLMLAGAHRTSRARRRTRNAGHALRPLARSERD